MIMLESIVRIGSTLQQHFIQISFYMSQNFLFLQTQIWLVAGLVLGALLIFYARRFSLRGERKILAQALVIAAVLYMVFAFIWGDMKWVLIELSGILVYGFFVWAAFRYSGYWLAVGWAFHPLWDVALHLVGPGNQVAPEWYAVACISFDLLVALYIFFRVRLWNDI